MVHIVPAIKDHAFFGYMISRLQDVIFEKGEDDSAIATAVHGLESVRADEPLTVGIFDRDREGFEKGFKGLNNNFKLSSFSNDVKIQKYGTSAAILLLVPTGREQYAQSANLPLEFYFNDEYLETEVNGKRLVLKQRKIRRFIDSLALPLDEVASSEPHLRQIEPSSKKHFAEHIVPTLPPKAFDAFRPLFELVQQAFEAIRAIKIQPS